jgi:hypothetical protein
LLGCSASEPASFHGEIQNANETTNDEGAVSAVDGLDGDGDVENANSDVFDLDEKPSEDAVAEDVVVASCVIESQNSCTPTEDTSSPALPPVQPKLGVESSDCNELNIAACDKTSDGSGLAFWYTCYNYQHKVVAQAYTNSAHPELDTIQDLPCSATAINVWAQAFDACWNKVPPSALPESPLKSLFNIATMPSEICSNFDGTKYHFTAGCSRHDYVITTVGPFSLKSGKDWMLLVSPPNALTLATSSPWSRCCSFSAGAHSSSMGNWALGTAMQDNYFIVSASDISFEQPNTIEWSSVLSLVNSAFKGCGSHLFWD